MSCRPLWTELHKHLTMSIMSEALATVEVCVVQLHQNFCAAGKGRNPSWQFTLEFISLESRNGKVSSCPLAILKGFCAWGCGRLNYIRPQKSMKTTCGCGKLHNTKLLWGLEGGPETRCPTVQKQPLFNTPTCRQDSLQANISCMSSCPGDNLGNSKFS